MLQGIGLLWAINLTRNYGSSHGSAIAFCQRRLDHQLIRKPIEIDPTKIPIALHSLPSTDTSSIRRIGFKLKNVIATQE